MTTPQVPPEATCRRAKCRKMRIFGHSRWALVLLHVFGSLMVAQPAQAQSMAGAFDEWIVLTDGALSVALTVDAEGSAFGVACAPACRVYIEVRSPCLAGDIYHVSFEGKDDFDFVAPMICVPTESGDLLEMAVSEEFLTLLERAGMATISFDARSTPGETFEFDLRGGAPAVALAIARQGDPDRERDIAS